MNSLKQLLNTYFQRNPVHKGIDLSLLYQRWDTLLGAYLSQRIMPVSYEQGTLICYVNSSSLIQELKLGLAKEIIQRLQEINLGVPIQHLRVVSEPAVLPSHVLKAFRQISETEHQVRRGLSIGRQVNLSARQKMQIDIETACILQPETRQKAQKFIAALAQRQLELASRNWVICRSCQTYYAPQFQSCPFCSGDKL